METITVLESKEIDKVRLAKLLAHLGNENEGEASNARRLADRLLKEAGFKFSDVPAIFGSKEAAVPSNAGWSGSAADMAEALRRAQEIERQRAEREAARRQAEARVAEEDARLREKARRRALDPKRNRLVARYGSEEKARSAHLSPQFFVESSYVEAFNAMLMSKGDLSFSVDFNDLPEELVEAIRMAFPFPQTIPDARAECGYWRHRVAELALLDYYENDFVLSKECEVRRDMVEMEFQSGLRATCMADVILRQRALMAGEFVDDADAQEAILADLEHLGLEATEKPAAFPPIQTVMPFRTATERREEVIRILSGPEATLSNREIARRLGIPDTTVAGIRRRMMAGEERLTAA
jgi:hypothetical protein